MLGCFGIKKDIDVRNKNILLVDDIITDGATLTVISDELFKLGVKSIVWLTFAKTHHILSEDFYICEKCKNYLSFRFNTKDGNWFLGCTNYPTCTQTYNVFLPDYKYVYSK